MKLPCLPTAAILCVCLTGPLQAQQPQTANAVEAASLNGAELEQRRAHIGAIRIIIDNVFDTSQPGEDRALYHWANRFHILTNEGVVRSVLLFDSGDPFQARVLDESARALRAMGFVAEATVTPGEYDAAGNTVAVEVRVRDAWSLKPEISFSRSGGKNEYALGFQEDNIFGSGKSFTVAFERTIDRDAVGLWFSDPNVGGSRTQLAANLADADDGGRIAVEGGRPFFGLDTRWSVTGSIDTEERIDSMYELGEVIDEFSHKTDGFSIEGGRLLSLVGDRALRLVGGLTYEEDHFEPTNELPFPAPLLLPADRKLTYPWIGVHWLRNDYREVSELNDMGRIEDISLGLDFSASLGYSSRSFGADRNATIWELSIGKGWEPGGGGRLFLIDFEASARRESAGTRNAVFSTTARYYHRNLGRHLFSTTLSTTISNALDTENQTLLGGDNGLRGFPIRYQSGERSAVLTLEQRFFTDWYPFSLIRVGYAAFFDIGRVWGQDPRTAPSLGTLYDIGIGLRLTSPRSSGRSVLHVDLAFPVNGDPSIDSVQFVVEKKRSF